jgi:ATP-binding cassette subfamily B protein RaxB
MAPGTALQPAGQSVTEQSATDHRGLAERLHLRRPSVPLMLQSEAAECGLACLGMIAGYHGHRIDLASLRRRFPPSMRGVRLDQLMETAAALHLSARPVRLELRDLCELRTPCVLHWDFSHFVVLVRARGGGGADIHDPAVGRRRYRRSEISRHFTGVALELQPSPAFEVKQEYRRAKIQELWTRARGLAGSFGTIFALSVLLQLLVLAAPFYTQFVVDDALTKYNENLLTVLALGFGLLLLIQSAVSCLRQYVVLYAGSMLNFQMTSNLMSHLIRLPLSYFEKRHVGEVLSRFESLAPIQELLATGFATGILDGLMGVLTLAMMLLYSPVLASITAASVILYGVVRATFYRPLRQLFEEQIFSHAKEQSVLIETLRGMQPIKVLGGETQREGLWQNRRADALNAEVRTARWSMAFSTLQLLLSGAENLLVIYVGAHLVLSGAFSVGMLYAFIAYKQQFSQRVSELIEWAIRYRMLDVHLARLSDIVHTREETGVRGEAGVELRLQGRIELRNVSFRYSESDPYVLRNISTTIEAGTSVAVIGRSGSGKTTLVKIVLGLLEPTDGEILVDGRPLRQMELGAYRRQIGAVMQDDQMFEGTIAENISGFDRKEDPSRIEAAARSAQIHDEILAMRMGYRSLIGNMGASLSGGQRQRILLARALYRNPRILVLDEGTANLDLEMLNRVQQTIAQARATRLLATHQPELVRSCDRILLVTDTQVLESARVGEEAARTLAAG